MILPPLAATHCQELLSKRWGLEIVHSIKARVVSSLIFWRVYRVTTAAVSSCLWQPFQVQKPASHSTPPQPSNFTFFPPSFPRCSLSHGGGGINIAVPFRAECPLSSSSAWSSYVSSLASGWYSSKSFSDQGWEHPRSRVRSINIWKAIQLHDRLAKITIVDSTPGPMIFPRLLTRIIVQGVKFFPVE